MMQVYNKTLRTISVTLEKKSGKARQVQEEAYNVVLFTRIEAKVSLGL